MSLKPLLDLIAQARDEQWVELDLTDYQLSELPPEIGGLTQLQKLVLGKWDEDEGRIGIGLQRLPEALGQLGNLRELSLAGGVARLDWLLSTPSRLRHW
jgi:hypothetical protein